MSKKTQSTAIILLAYGGPNSLDDIQAYLLDIRGGRHTPDELVEEITERYHKIGGSSPLLGITQSVAMKLQAATGLPVYVGMRHWHPYIKDVVGRMVTDGVRHVVAICMAPHYSMLSIAKYREQLEAAIAEQQAEISVAFVENWHAQPEYLDGLAANVRDTLLRFDESERDSVLTVFTAHSLPEFILDRGDPYDDQLKETAKLLAERLDLSADQWAFSYQSAAQTSMPWLGPQIEDFIVKLAEQGHKNVIVTPIGFIADHVEVLYDIDIEVQGIAQAHGIRIERSPMLNDGDALISALAAIAQTHLNE